jgi:secreted PhoX family phosphatase
VLLKDNELVTSPAIIRQPVTTRDWDAFIKALNSAEVYYSNNGAVWIAGTGDPDGAVVAPVGSLFSRTDGGASTTLYVKESGTDEKGWVAK